MLTLTFPGQSFHQGHSIGPAPYVRLVGASVRRGPDDEEVAVHRNHFWVAADKFFTSMNVEGPVAVRFEDREGNRSVTLGPFHRLHLADGTIHADGPTAVFFARLNHETGRWQLHSQPEGFPVVVFEGTERRN